MEQAAHVRLRALQDQHWWFEGRRRILSQVLADLEPPPAARILEVGCGSGGNLKMLGRFGRVTGIEPDAGARDHAAALGAVSVRDGSLPDNLPFAPASFDLVCAFDVIEHVADDRASVAALARLVGRGGYVAATVPAYGWMWSAHDVEHHHQRRYDRAGFQALFQDAGLTVVKASHFNTLLLPIAVAARWIKAVLGLHTPDDAMPAPWINRVLLGVLGSERGWLRRGSLPLGLSILVIARRDA